MTTTSRFWGSLFWGGTTSSCNDDPRSCDGDPTSCDDDPVPADRTPLVEASGMAGAPPWAPLIGSGHPPGRARPRPAPPFPGLGGFSTGLGVVLPPATCAQRPLSPVWSDLQLVWRCFSRRRPAPI